MATVCMSHFLSNGPLMAQSCGTVTFSKCTLSRENCQSRSSVSLRWACANPAVRATHSNIAIRLMSV